MILDWLRSCCWPTLTSSSDHDRDRVSGRGSGESTWHDTRAARHAVAHASSRCIMSCRITSVPTSSSRPAIC